MKVAVVNCGSYVTIKYEVFDMNGTALVAKGLIEKIGTTGSVLRQSKKKADGLFDDQTHAKPLADHKRGV